MPRIPHGFDVFSCVVYKKLKKSGFRNVEFLRSGAHFWEAKITQNDDFLARSKIAFRIVKTTVCGTFAPSEARKNEMKKVMFFLKKNRPKNYQKYRKLKQIETPSFNYDIIFNITDYTLEKDEP